MLPAVAVGIGLNYLLDLSRVPLMLAGIAIYAVVYLAGMWLMGLNDFEKDLLRKPLKKFLKR